MALSPMTAIMRRVNVGWPGLYRPNPKVYLKPEKGRPVKQSTRWIDFQTGENLSNTYWLRGIVDFSGRLPRVEVTGEATAAIYNAAKSGRKMVTYLLHPDKFNDFEGIEPAIGMIPNLSLGGPGKPFAYALSLLWNVPVMLRTKPGNKANPRGWFEGHGAAWAREPVGRVKLYSGNQRLRDVWKVVQVRHADDPPDPGTGAWTRLEP